MGEAVTREVVLEEFLAGAEQLAELVEDLPEGALALSLGPGEWSIREIAHHVCDNDVWPFAMKKALATPGASIRFAGFPGNEAWAEGLAFKRRGIQAAVALMRAQNAAMVELARALPDQWNNTICIEDEQGQVVAQVSVAQIFSMLTEHTQEHLASIRAVRQKQGL